MDADSRRSVSLDLFLTFMDLFMLCVLFHVCLFNKAVKNPFVIVVVVL